MTERQRARPQASDRQGSNFESCGWRAVSFHLSHHPQEALLAQFSLYVHKGGQKTFIYINNYDILSTFRTALESVLSTPIG